MAASKDQEKVAEQLEAFLSPNHEEFASWYPHAAVAAARGSVPDEPGFVRLFTEGPRGAKRADQKGASRQITPTDSEHHVSAVEVFSVTDPCLAQTGGFIRWIASEEESEGLECPAPAAEVHIEGVDVDVEIARALRER